MRAKNFLTNAFLKLTTAKEWVVFLVYTGIAILIRFPFFFRDYIDRDESTFILMGQSIVDGHLPYTDLWDLKPPIVFYVFAMIIYVFGKSFIAIRLAGAILVGATAFYTYKISQTVSSKSIAWIVGALGIYLASLFGSLQGLMSEHVSAFFMLLGLYYLIRSQNGMSVLMAGIVLGLSLMTKINLGYGLVLLMVYYLLQFRKVKNRISHLMMMLILGGGILGVVLLTCLPFALTGQEEIWWNAVFKAPLAYVEATQGSFLNVLPFGLLILGLIVLFWKRGALNLDDHKVVLVVLLLLGLLFSFVRSGKINGHYLIQVYPLILILISVIWAHYKENITPTIILIFLAIFLVAPLESYQEYRAIKQHRSTDGNWYNGEGFTVPQYIEESNLSTKNILFLEYHIAYWLLNQKPPTKAATHPSNICREELFPYYNDRRSSLEEITYIMEQVRPQLVIIRKGKPVFDKNKVEENELISTYLKSYYQTEAEIDNALILKRL